MHGQPHVIFKLSKLINGRRKGYFFSSKCPERLWGSNQHPNQQSPGFCNRDTAVRPEDGHLHHISRLGMNGGIPQISHKLRGMHQRNFIRLEITRQSGTIIKEKEISAQRPPRKSCMWVQRPTG